MSTNEIIPSQEPSADSSMGATLREVFKKLLQSVDGMLPATVVSYNRATNRATVVPSVNMVTTNGENLQRAPYANIPVLAYGGGDFLINFPLKPGDTGWIEACDRDVSLWLQGRGSSNAPPNTHRVHSFSDGRFIPDMLGNYTIADEAGTTGLTIQHKDGESAIVLLADRILIKSGGVDIVNTTRPGTVTGGLVIDGITFGTHKHTGVQSGGSTTAGPVA